MESGTNVPWLQFKAPDVPNCVLEKIRRLNENKLGMKLILMLINEDEELQRRSPAYTSAPHMLQCDHAVSKMRLVLRMNPAQDSILVGGSFHLSGRCQDASHFARKEDSTYV